MASQMWTKKDSKFEGKSGMDGFRKGWFTELGILHCDILLSVKVKNIIFHQKSKYQDICIFDSTKFGRIFLLDDVIQLTEFDEFVYSEMAAFLPLNSHPNPKKVLIIGGGDGGVVREVAKHPLVESIVLCEIDQLVIDASKKYLPFTATGFDSPKLTVYVGDGTEYARKHKEEFDVIISDATDPIGPGMNLYSKSYFESLREALKPGGILLAQGQDFWVDMPVIQNMMTQVRPLFPVVDYATTSIPTYPAGSLGYILCSTSPYTNFRNPLHKFPSKVLEEMNLKYYNADMHRASMALPLYLAEELGVKWELS